MKTSFLDKLRWGHFLWIGLIANLILAPLLSRLGPVAVEALSGEPAGPTLRQGSDYLVVFVLGGLCSIIIGTGLYVPVMIWRYVSRGTNSTSEHR
jgi:hypothetical protein